MDLDDDVPDAELLGDESEDRCPPAMICDDLVFDMAFHPSAPFLAVGLVSGTVTVHEFRRTETRQVAELPLHSQGIVGMEFSETGSHLVTASSDSSLKVTDCTAQQIVIHIPKGKGNPHKLGISSINVCSNELVSTGDDDGLVALWDMRSSKVTHKYHEHGDFISQMLFFSEVNQLITSSGDTCVGAFDLRAGKVIDFSEKRKDDILCMAFIPATNDLVCGTPTGLLPVWKYGAWSRPYDVHKGHPKEVETILSYNDNIFLTGACDGVVRVIQHYPTRRLLCHLGGHDRRRNGISRIRISHDRQLLAACGNDRMVQFFDIEFLSRDEELDKLRSRAEQRHIATLRALNAEERAAKEEEERKRTAAMEGDGRGGGSDDDDDSDDDSDDDDDSDWTEASSDDEEVDEDAAPSAAAAAAAGGDDDDAAHSVKRRKGRDAEGGGGGILDEDEPVLPRTTKRERVAAAKWLKEAQKDRIEYSKERGKKRVKAFWGDIL